MTNRPAALGLVLVLAVGLGACRDSGGRSGVSATTASTGAGAASSAASATSPSGPVTEADVAEVNQILRRLDAEIDRLESDLAATEGEPGVSPGVVE